MSSPSFTPASPSFTPASPSFIPASPSSTPASPSFTPASPSFTPASPSSTPASPSASQHPQAASVISSSALQTPDDMDATALYTTRQLDDLPDDPTQRSTGTMAKVMNNEWTEATRPSEVQEMLQLQCPHLLLYYEDRRTGKIEADPFEEVKDPVFGEKAKRLYRLEHGKVHRVFFEMDYTRGFSGRGVLPESRERPGLIGPRNEKVEEIAPPAAGLRYEQADRPLWQAIDNKSGWPLERSKDEEEVGPFGESRDDQDVGPLGELSAKSVGTMSKEPVDSAAASSSHTASAFPNDPQALPTSSFLHLASDSSVPSRKRARDTEEDAEEDEIQLQQKRRRMDNVLGIVRESASQLNRSRMDDILGIVRNDANAARAPQSVGAAMTPDLHQSRKRARGLDDNSEDSTTGPSQKRVRLYPKPREIRNAEENNVADGHVGATIRDDSTLAPRPASSGEAQRPAMVDRVANTEVGTRASVEEGPFANDDAHEREDAVLDNEAVPSRTEWNTAHGINSDYANIRVRGREVYDITGQPVHLYLPTFRGSHDRVWSEEEKENLRVYIQDYGVGDWTALSQSMNRTVTELQNIYREIIFARNKQAGRPECAGIPGKYPDLTPPPLPEDPAEQEAQAQPVDSAPIAELPNPVQESPVVLRPLVDNGFPEADDEDCASEIEEGEISEEDRPAERVPASAQIGTGRISKTSFRRGVDRRAGHQLRVADLEEEQSIERERTREKVSSESMREEKGALNASVGIVVDPEGEGDVGQEQQLPNPPKSKNASTKGPLGLRLAGVCKLSGSLRRGVPRHAAGLRKVSWTEDGGVWVVG